MSDAPILLTPLESDFAKGDRLGNNATPEVYELEELLGCGTTGCVWKARPLVLTSLPTFKLDGARCVAIKLFHRTVTDAENAVPLLKQEVGALIRLAHPSIINLLDCGYDPKVNRLYIVTNLISQAQSITEYCNHGSLSIRKRLQQFLHVCEAVKHAHQNKIFHLDIKPSNVQVSPVTAQSMPILIDFSLAQTHNSLKANKRFRSPYPIYFGTPAYMSPQQAGMPGEVSNQSDIYSLGILLFELLTSITPYECYIHDLESEGVAFIPDSSARSVNERFAAIEAAFTRSADKQSCNGLSTLVSSIPGELQTILKQSLRNELTERYMSVTELIRDIEDYLNHKPIANHSTAYHYWLQKYLHRHVAMLVVVVSVFVFISRTAINYRHEANLQQTIQQETAKHFAMQSHVNRIFDGLLKDVGYTMAGYTRSPQLRGLLDITQQRIASEFASDINSQTEARIRLATVYEYLGLYDRFVEIASSNLFLSTQTTNAFLIARARAQLGQALSDQGKLRVAEVTLTSALMAQESFIPTKLLDRIYSMTGSNYDATLVSECYKWTNVLQEIATVQIDLGDVLDDEHRLVEACSEFKHAISIYGILGSGCNADLATAKDDLAFALMEQRDIVGAQRQFDEALAIRTNMFGPIHREVANSLNDIAVLYRLEGPKKWQEAERLQREALKMQLASLAADHPIVATSYDNLGNIFYYRHLYNEAQQYYEKALKIRMDVLGPDYRETATSFYELVRCLRRQSKYSEACDTARKMFERQLPDATTESRVRYTDIAAYYVQTLIDTQQYEKAAVLANNILEQRESICPGTWRCSSMRGLLGIALLNQGEPKMALESLLPAFEFFRQDWRQVPVEGLNRLQETGRALMDCYTRLGQLEYAVRVVNDIGGRYPAYPEWESDTREGGL